MGNGPRLYRAFLTNGHSKRFSILPNIHPTVHPFTHGRRFKPSKAKGAMLRDTSTLSEEDQGIKLATFRLPAKPLYLLSHMSPLKIIFLPMSLYPVPPGFRGPFLRLLRPKMPDVAMKVAASFRFLLRLQLRFS